MSMSTALPGKYYEVFQILALDVFDSRGVIFETSLPYRKLDKAEEKYPELSLIIKDYQRRYQELRHFLAWGEIYRMLQTGKLLGDYTLDDTTWSTLLSLYKLEDLSQLDKTQLQNALDLFSSLNEDDTVTNDKTMIGNRKVLKTRIADLLNSFN